MYLSKIEMIVRSRKKTIFMIFWLFYQKYLIYQSSQGQVHPLLMNDLMTRMRMMDLKQDLMVVNELKIVINS